MPARWQRTYPRRKRKGLLRLNPDERADELTEEVLNVVLNVVLNDAGQAEKVQSKIAQFESTEFLLSSLSMMLECVEAFDRQPNTEARRALLAHVSSEQRRLYAQYWKLLEQRQA